MALSGISSNSSSSEKAAAKPTASASNSWRSSASGGRMPRARSSPSRIRSTTKRLSRLAPPTCSRRSSSSERTWISMALTTTLADATAVVKQPAPRAEDCPSAVGVATDDREHELHRVHGEQREERREGVTPPPPGRDDNNWCRRWRSWRLARRVPMAVTGRSPEAIVSRCATLAVGATTMRAPAICARQQRSRSSPSAVIRGIEAAQASRRGRCARG